MDSSYPDPSQIGRAFVKQYYTQLHHDPSQMHRFYLEQSSMVHGGSEVGSAQRVIGQKVREPLFINPRCACAAMATVLCLSVCERYQQLRNYTRALRIKWPLS